MTEKCRRPWLLQIFSTQEKTMRGPWSQWVWLQEAPSGQPCKGRKNSVRIKKATGGIIQKVWGQKHVYFRKLTQPHNNLGNGCKQECLSPPLIMICIWTPSSRNSELWGSKESTQHLWMPFICKCLMFWTHWLKVQIWHLPGGVAGMVGDCSCLLWEWWVVWSVVEVGQLWLV